MAFEPGSRFPSTADNLGNMGCMKDTDVLQPPAMSQSRQRAGQPGLKESFNRACAGRADPVELAGDSYLNFAERRGLGPQFQLSLL